jgi:putative N6-adenine-specific DNA methylase
MYEYQKDKTFFAQAPGMMETICEEELKELGATDTKVAYRGVYFKAEAEALYKINYTSRMISRVLAPLITFQCHNTNVLKKIAEKIQWEKIFSLEQTFSITASVAKSQITNSLYASQCLKDGIADYFRKVCDDKRPDVNTTNPDVRINLHIEKDEAVISLDTSGESLHKRGYRLLAGEAPMQETLAAAIIRLSKWDGNNPLWDCMCGSGTIISEALMSYCRIPAQYLRKNFGFFYLPDFDKSIWDKLKAECEKEIRPLPKGLICGSDKSQKMIEVAQDNLARLPFSDAIKLECHPFQHVKQFENGTLITNPPYGIRLGKFDEVQELYKELGDFIKQKCKGTTAYIYTGDPVLRKSIGLKTSRRIPLVNGKLEGVLVQIDSYEGSKKRYYAEYKAAEEEELKEKTGKMNDKKSKRD